MTNHFDQAAQNWDNNPMHLERTEAITAELLKRIPIREGMKALEFGSGTGLMSFALKQYFSEITLMDSSVEMNKQAKAKVKAAGVDHLKPLHFDLEKDDYTREKFDIIFTQMVMHHVKDVPAMIQKFNKLLNPGGFIAIADLYTEDATFHDSGFDVHPGFDPDYMKDTIIKAGFLHPVLNQCFEIKRSGNDNIVKVYPVFLVVAKK